MPYEGEVPATQDELRAHGLLVGPFGKRMDPSTPTLNQEVIKGQKVNAAGKQAVELAQSIAEFKQAAGLTPEGSIPTSTKLGALVSPVMGLLPYGRTVPRMGLQVLGNMGLGAGTEMVGEVMDKPAGQRNLLGAGMIGAAKGVLPGILQAGAGAFMGPNRATLRTQKQIGSVQSAVSPEVASIMNKAKPADFLKSKTPVAMSKEAGALLDKMEAEVGDRLGTMTFKRIAPNGKLFPKAAPGDTFITMRDEIKELRREADLNRGGDVLMKKKNRDLLAQAKQLEEAMISQMPPDVAKTYREALTTHRANMDAVRFVSGVQRAKQIEGKVNPYDRPELGEASRQGTHGHTGSQMAHGALGAVEAITGRPWGAAYNLSRASGQGKVPRVAESMPGFASRIPGMALGTGARLGEDYMAPSKAEAGEKPLPPALSALAQQRAGERGSQGSNDFLPFLKYDIAEPLLRMMFAPTYGTYAEPKPVFKREQ